PASSPPSAPARRPGDDALTEGARREQPSVPRRPLPPVAAPQAPAHPPGSAPRPASHAAEGKTQRPEKRMTREEVLNLMRSGQLGNQPAPGSPPSGLRGGQPPRGPVPGASPRGERAGPGTGLMPGMPGRRSHTTAPGAPPYVGPATPAAPPPAFDEEEERKAKGRVGSSADRAGRRARATAKRGQKGGGQRFALAPTRKNHALIEPPISVRNLSEAIGIKANDLLRKLMAMGEMATINTSLDDDMALMLSMEFGVELEVVHPRTAEDELLDSLAPGDASENLEPRPPVITILGHVDHGKTSLLDRIRKSNVVQSESGGITQHIGAYQVEYNGKPITFVDTPGHEAFTAMRARGANVTDIVVLVVAADDGVMPQTVEAIAHAKAAEVPIVVALNKIDLPNADTPANINKIYGELSQQGLHPVEWGGDVEVVKTSTVTGQGLSDMLATLEAIADLHELKADPSRPASGTCLEASLSEGRGVVATVLIQDGTLRVGDVLVCGDGYGRVRALFDDRGRSI